MGFTRIEECIFTGEKAEPIINDITVTEYFVTINKRKHLIKYSELNINDPFFQENKNFFFALLYNNEWFEDEAKLITKSRLEQLLKQKIIRKNPEDKLEQLFLKLSSFQEEDGQLINAIEIDYDNLLWKILYFKSLNELNYYVEGLNARGIIAANFVTTRDRHGLLKDYRITFEGLNYEIKLKEEGEKSNKCFVAMAFRPETAEIRKAIKQALMSTGFIPLLIDEQNIDSDKTINDEIIANLKRCKFCIADFTFHSPGVYFESGHALGQAKKVIYTCRKDEFEKTHFDIKPLQHIIYANYDQLEHDLISKIEAWIK